MASQMQEDATWVDELAEDPLDAVPKEATPEHAVPEFVEEEPVESQDVVSKEAVPAETVVKKNGDKSEKPASSLPGAGQLHDDSDGSAEDRDDGGVDEDEGNDETEQDDTDEDNDDHLDEESTGYKAVVISERHSDLVHQALRGMDIEKLLADSKEYLEKNGDINSTILHVISDRWSARLEALFRSLMAKFPYMYSDEDYLGRTVLDRNQVGRTRDRFAKFFVDSFPAQAAELVNRRPKLLGFLLSALHSGRAWLQLIKEILPATLLVMDSGGDTFLHNVVHKAHEQAQAPGQGRWLLQVIKQVADTEPETLMLLNAEGKTAYQHHIALLQAAQSSQRELPRQRSKEKLVAKKPQLRESHVRAVGKKTQDVAESTIPIPILIRSATKPIRPKAAPATLVEKVLDRESDPPELRYEISTVFLNAMYRLLDVGDIRDILHGAGEEVEFDLDFFELGNDSESSNSRGTVESILKLLRLPSYAMNVCIPRCSPDTAAMSGIFQRLRAQGVTRIKRLDVDEDIDRPHSDEAVTEALQGFKIEELSWRKTDICSSVLKTAAPTIKKVHLYSSGNHAVLRSWSAKDGLLSLPHLLSVNLFIIPQVESTRAASEYAEEFEARIRESEETLRDPENSSPRTPLRVAIDTRKPWRHGEATTWTKALSEPKGQEALAAPVERQPEWTLPPRLLGLLRGLFRNRNELPKSRVKIAIIDDGVDIDRVGREAVIHGASFASQRPKGLKPYYFSATGQGTHMASLISRFYPQLQLYIARVDSDDAKIRPIIEAVKWATKQGVDIIVLGGTLDQATSAQGWDMGMADLSQALLTAVRECDLQVLLPVSDAAVGLVHHAAILRIAATRWNEDERQPAPEEADFTLSVKGLDLPASLSKNATATAYAAGLAALVVSSIDSEAGFSPPKLVNLFQSLNREPGSKYVSVDSLIKVVEQGGREEQHGRAKLDMQPIFAAAVNRPTFGSIENSRRKRRNTAYMEEY